MKAQPVANTAMGESPTRTVDTETTALRTLGDERTRENSTVMLQPTIQKFITRIDKLQTESRADQIKFGKVDLDAGKLKYERDSVRIYEGDKKFVEYSMLCDLKDLRKYGPGIYLFFDWMKQMITLMIFMSIFGGVSMYFNNKGQRLRESEITNPLDKTMLANSALDFDKESFFDGSVINWNNLFSDKDPRTKAILADYIGTVFMFLYIFLYNWRLKRLVHDAKQECTSISSYSVEVSGIPPTTTAASIEKLMVKFGKVAEITIGRNYLGVFEKYEGIKNLEIKLRYDYAIMEIKGGDQNLQQQMNTFKERIIDQKKTLYNEMLQKGANISKHDDFPAWNAYVIFESLEAKAKLLTRANGVERHNNLRKIFCCMSKKTFIEYNGQPLKFRGCDEPTNIKYENVCKSTKLKVLNRFLTAVMVITVIFIDFLLIYFVNKITIPTRNDQCIISPTLQDMLNNPNSESDYTLQYCYCRNLPYSALLDSTNYKYCNLYYTSLSKALVVSIGSSLLIMISNSLLRSIINKFSAKMMFNRVTSELSTVSYIIFFSEFINFLAITILLRGSFLGVKPSEALSELLGWIHPSLKDNNPIYKDYTTSWYLDIGTKIMNELMIETLFPHIFMVFVLPIVKTLRFSRAKNAKIQYDVITNMRSSRFDLPPKAAHVLCMFFVSVLLSSGIPLLLPYALIFMVVYYWLNKMALLKYSKTPLQIDESFALSTGKLMYLAVFLHCYMGFFLYRAQGIFTLPAGFNPLSNTSISIGVKAFDDNAKDHIVYFVVGGLSALLVIWHFLITPFIELTGITSLCCKKKDEEDLAPLSDQSAPIYQTKTFSEEKKKLHMLGCISYNILNNPEYHDLVISMDLGTSNSPAKPNLNSFPMRPNPGLRPGGNRVMPLNSPNNLSPQRPMAGPGGPVGRPGPPMGGFNGQYPQPLGQRPPGPGGPPGGLRPPGAFGLQRPMGIATQPGTPNTSSPARPLPSSARNLLAQPPPGQLRSMTPSPMAPRPFGASPLQPQAPRPFGAAPVRPPLSQ